MLLDVETITHIPLPPHPCPDQVYWFYDKRGVYTAKREYQLALRLNHYQGPSTLSSSQVWWKFIWSLFIPPKMRIFLWWALLDILPTSCNLFKRQVIHSPTCQRCNRMPEDTFHALVGCQFAIKVRRLSRLANIVSNYPSINFSCFVQTLVDSLSKETFESFMALAWSIWRDKNLFLHNKRVNDMWSAVFWAESVIESYQLAQHSSIGRVSPTQNHKDE